MPINRACTPCHNNGYTNISQKILMPLCFSGIDDGSANNKGTYTQYLLTLTH